MLEFQLDVKRHSRNSRTENSRAASTGPQAARSAFEKYTYQPTGPFKDISGRWLLNAFLVTLAVAAISLYLAACLLFYHGQWQFAFHTPRNSPNAASVIAHAGFPIEDIPFDFTEEGVAQLDGWWAPAAKGAAHPNQVVLFFHNGDTALTGNLNALRAFHALGVNVFAFDYRGFGASGKEHPSQDRAYADGAAALRYLTDTRQIGPRQIVLYGAEIGSAVAIHVAQQSSPQQSTLLGGVVLENPKPSLLPDVERRSLNLLPLHLLFRQRFDITHAAASVKTRKLFLIGQSNAVSALLYDKAAQPKNLVQLQSGVGTGIYETAQWQQAMQDFLQSEK